MSKEYSARFWIVMLFAASLLASPFIAVVFSSVCSPHPGKTTDRVVAPLVDQLTPRPEYVQGVLHLKWDGVAVIVTDFDGDYVPEEGRVRYSPVDKGESVALNDPYGLTKDIPEGALVVVYYNGGPTGDYAITAVTQIGQ